MEERFETTDIALAAYLITKGVQVLATHRQSGRTAFCFPQSAREKAEGYFQDALVPARIYFNAVRDLRTLIHIGSEK